MLKVNTDIRTDRVNEEAQRQFDIIAENAANGTHVTSMLIDKDIAGDVRSKLNEMLKAEDADFTWQIIRTGSNQFTGRPEHYTSETIGDQRRYQIYLN